MSRAGLPGSAGRWMAAALLLAVFALVLPFALADYSLRVTVLSLQAGVAVIGLCIAFGWAGLVQLGQAAFIGIGAYTSAVLALRFGLGFWLTMPVAMLASSLVALLLAVPMLRLRGHYLALATVGLNVTAEIVAKNWIGVTGGDDGLSAIPGVSVFGRPIEGDFGFYYLSLGLLTVVAGFALALRHSRFGRAMIAVRDDEMAAGTSGVPVVRTKVLAFVIASALAGLSGALYAHHARYVSPADFDLSRSVAILVMLIVGGETSVAGAIIGAVLLSFAPEWLRVVGDAYLAVFGVAVLLLLVLMPDGIVGRLHRLRRRLGRGRSSAGNGNGSGRRQPTGREAPTSGLPVPATAARQPTAPDGAAGSAGIDLAALPGGDILAVRGLSRGFGGLLAVDRVDLDLPDGRLLALIGPNGAGKSTTVNLLAGVLLPSAGSIRLGGVELTGLSADRVARAGLSRTFQNGRLFTRLSVLENVLVGAHGRDCTGFWAAIVRSPGFRREQRVLRVQAMDLLESLGLATDAHRDVRELPYGQQRKIEIARALILQPRVLMLDEPAAGLNSREVEELIAYVSTLRAKGLSILLIEHNMGLVMRLADRIAVLNFGRLIAAGEPADVRASEAVIEAYLGRRKTAAIPASALALSREVPDAAS